MRSQQTYHRDLSLGRPAQQKTNCLNDDCIVGNGADLERAGSTSRLLCAAWQVLPRQTQAALLHGCCHRCRRSVTQSFNCIIAFTRVCSSLTIACSFAVICHTKNTCTSLAPSNYERAVLSQLFFLRHAFSWILWEGITCGNNLRVGEKCTCYSNRIELYGPHSQMQIDTSVPFHYRYCKADQVQRLFGKHSQEETTAAHSRTAYEDGCLQVSLNQSIKIDIFPSKSAETAVSLSFQWLPKIRSSINQYLPLLAITGRLISQCGL